MLLAPALHPRLALGEDQAFPKIPLWQQGVSNWTGTDYLKPFSKTISQNDTKDPTGTATSVNVDAATKVGTTAAISRSRYTMPIDPTSQYRGAIGALPVLPVANQPGPTGAAQVKYTPDPLSLGLDGCVEPLLLGPAILGNGEQGNGGSTSGDLSSEQKKILETAIPNLNSPESQPIAAETLPLEEKVQHWYHYPKMWMKGWNSNAEFGINGSSGNATTMALQTGLELTRKTDDYTFSIDTDYRFANNRGLTTEDNGRFNIDYDRLFPDSPWSLFAKYGMEWDTFKAFDLRININGGFGYHWIRTDDTTLVTRLGSGASREIGAPDDSWTPEAVFGGEWKRQLTERQKLSAKVDYFPAWEDFSDFRVVSDVAWEMLLDGTDNLSLKLAATDRYDSTPQGAKANDIYYSCLLIYKF